MGLGFDHSRGRRRWMSHLYNGFLFLYPLEAFRNAPQAYEFVRSSSSEKAGVKRIESQFNWRSEWSSQTDWIPNTQPYPLTCPRSRAARSKVSRTRLHPPTACISGCSSFASSHRPPGGKGTPQAESPSGR